MIFSLFGRKSAHKPLAKDPRSALEPLPVRSSGLTAKIDAIESEMIHNGPSTQLGPITITGSTRTLTLETGVAGQVYVPSARGSGQTATMDHPAAALDPLQHLPADLRASLSAPVRIEFPEVDLPAPASEPPIDAGAIRIATTDLPAPFEEAAVLYSNGQSAEARAVLQRALEDPALGPHERQAWLMLLDLHQGLGAREDFDALAMQFSLRFETSPPSWDEALARSACAEAAATTPIVLALPAMLDAHSSTVLDRAIPGGERSSALDLDLRPVRDLDPDGAARLCLLMRALAEPGAPVRIIGLESLLAVLAPKVRKDHREDTESLWLLLLELLRLQDRPQEFEDRSIDYCVTFEVSPPAWVARAAHLNVLGGSLTGSASQRGAGVSEVGWLPCADGLQLVGVLDGRATEVIAAMRSCAQARTDVHLDCRRLRRVDFGAAGDLLNEIMTLKAAGKRLRMSGVGPMIGALLAVMGIPDLIEVRPRGY